MTSLQNVLSKIIHGRDEFCCLCFDVIGNDAVYLKDEHTFEVILFVLGEELVNTLQDGMFCNRCLSCAQESYKFIKMCRENCESLHKTIDTITESFAGFDNQSDTYNSVYIYLDRNNFNCYVQPMWGARKYDHKRMRKRIRNTVNYDISTVPITDIVHNTSTGEHKCKVCSKIFKESTKLRHHYFKNHYPRDVKCAKCSKSFISDEMLNQHNLRHHSPLKCKLCGKCFNNKYVLRKHESNHNIEIVCQQCGRVYKSNEAFKKHIIDNICIQRMRKSSSQGTYFCDYCDKRFCHKPYLAKHIKYEHENAKGFICRFCNKQFYTPSGLQSHIVKHTLEKKFECKECGGRFVSKTSLLYHTRLHTGEKPYHCDYCDKSFLSASRRIDHVRRHHMAPSLECDICHNKFKATGSLLKHRKRHFNPNSKLSTEKICFAV